MGNEIGMMGVGVGEIGRFDRTLPPSTRVQYDPKWELGLEVMRWFHYRHGTTVIHRPVFSVEKLYEFMEQAYSQICKHKVPKSAWETLKRHIVEPHFHEFCELFKDVLAEIEILRDAR